MVKYSPANGRDEVDPWSGRILPAMGQLLKPLHLAPVLHNKKKLTHSSEDSAQSKKKKKDAEQDPSRQLRRVQRRDYLQSNG